MSQRRILWADDQIDELEKRYRSLVKDGQEQLEKMEDRMPYMAQLGWKFVRGGYGWAEFLLPSTGSALGGDSGLAGGALLSAVDHAGSLAAWMTSTLGDRTLFGSTVNTKLQTFPGNIVADMIGFEAKPYFEAETKAFMGKLCRHLSERHAGDPGPVLVRRLGSREFDHAVHDRDDAAPVEHAQRGAQAIGGAAIAVVLEVEEQLDGLAGIGETVAV